MGLKGHRSGRLSTSPAGKGAEWELRREGESRSVGCGHPLGLVWGKQPVREGCTRRREMERKGGNSGRGASRAGVTRDWSHTGRCRVWQDWAGDKRLVWPPRTRRRSAAQRSSYWPYCLSNCFLSAIILQRKKESVMQASKLHASCCAMRREALLSAVFVSRKKYPTPNRVSV